MLSTPQSGIVVTVSIDTEEDDWAAYVEHGASTRNIAHLRELQEHFDRWGARPTYLVNYAPLVDPLSIEVLAELASRESVEIGAHCHPWNTPPFEDGGSAGTMMCGLTAEVNAAKLREVGRRLEQELDVRPRSFRAGRWGLGPTVAGPLAELGYAVDCSVSPFIDWSRYGGPDYSRAPHRPYRFDPKEPLRPDLQGRLVELPTTVGFLRGPHRKAARTREWLEGSPLSKVRIVGALDRVGLLAKRWLSPEYCAGDVLVRLATAWVSRGERFLQLTFHSCALLPGATPFVHDEHERARFLKSVDRFLSFCHESNFTFATLSEAGRRIAGGVA